MILYDTVRSSVAIAAATDFLTFTTAAVTAIVITELDFEGMSNASAANETGIYTVTTLGVTGGTAITPTPVNRRSPAATCVVNGSWGTVPVVNVVLHTIPLNSNGQRYFWRAQNLYDVIPVPANGAGSNLGQLSFRQISGTGVQTGRVRHAEI